MTVSVFVDSWFALTHAIGAGLPEDREIRTTAPALLLNGDASANGPSLPDGADAVSRLSSATFEFCRDIYSCFKEVPELSELAVVAAQTGVSFSNLVQKAMYLRPQDFSSKVVVVKVRTGSEADDARCNMPWAELLEPNPELEVLTVEGGPVPDINRRPPEGTRFLDRQRLGGVEKIVHGIVRRFWRYSPVASPRGTFLVLRVNELLEETLLSLARRGFGFSYASLPATSNAGPVPVAREYVATLVASPIEDHVRDLVPAAAVPSLVKMYVDRLWKRMEAYSGSIPYWRETLDAHGKSGIRAVLTGTLPRPEVAALHRVCTERGIPLAAFQHGVTRELSKYHHHVQAIFEGNTSDVFYTFNEEACRISNTSGFNRAAVRPVGLPKRYSRSATYRRPQRGSPPILYASTSLYCGSVNTVAGGGTSDRRMAAAEARMVNDVLSRLPHRVLFKPYPNTRYLDDDPVWALAARADNIFVFPNRDDLTYLFPDCRIVVTARATSTVSWCLASGKPTVLVHYPDDRPFGDETLEAFDSVFFLFDGSEEDFVERLTRFLSQPIEDIERQWEEKSSERRTVMERFVGRGGSGAGRRAAQHLVDHMGMPQQRMADAVSS